MSFRLVASATLACVVGCMGPEPGDLHAVLVGPDASAEVGAEPDAAPVDTPDLAPVIHDATWALQAHATERAFPLAVAVASDGRIVVAVGFDGAVDFGLGVLAPRDDDPRRALALVAFDRDGAPLWNVRTHGRGEIILRSMAIAPNGDIVLGGRCTGALDFGGGALPAAFPTRGCLARYDRDGHPRDARLLPGEGGVTAVAFEASGALLRADFILKDVEIGGVNVSASATNPRTLLVREDPTGAHLLLSPTSRFFVDSLAVDPADGAIGIAAEISGLLAVGAEPIVPMAEYDALAAAFDPSGKVRWAWHTPSHSPSGGRTPQIASLRNGVENLAVFVSEKTAFGDRGDYAVQIGADGKVRWPTRIERVHSLDAIVTLADGDVAVVGTACDCDENESRLVRLAGASGAMLSARRIHTSPGGSAHTLHARSMAATPDGSVIIIGTFRGTLPLAASPLVTSATSDVFIAKVRP